MDIFGKLLSKCGFKVFTFNRFKLFDGFDYRRSILKAKCRVGMRPLSSSFENRVGGRKVITIHFRTPRWHKLMHTTQSEFDYLRDCDPVQYFDAIRYLLDLGYFVVVCSDGFKSGLASEGLLELDTLKENDRELQFRACEVSEFIVTADSGPFALGWLFDVPMLQVNIVNFYESFSLRSCDRCLFKGVRERKTMEFVNRSAFFDKFKGNQICHDDFEVVSNTSFELLSAVKEMIDSLNCAFYTVTNRQKEFLAVANQNLGNAKGANVKKDLLILTCEGYHIDRFL